MKVTIFIGSLIGGGAEKVACNLANYLAEKGHDVTMLVMMETLSTYPLNKSVAIEKLYCISENDNLIQKYLKRILRLKKYVIGSKTEIFIAFLPVTICLLLMFRKSIKVPVIISERNDPGSYGRLTKMFIRFFSKKADGMVFQTDDAKVWYKSNGVVLKNSVVIPNSVKSNLDSLRLNDLINENQIVAVGRLNKQKNYRLLIDAFEIIVKKYHNLKLEIYGDGEEKDCLLRCIKEKSMEDCVILKGYVRNVLQEISNAKMFVMTSDYEGMPNSLMEAMAIGIPCIATDCPCGGPHYLINSGENGILVDINDVFGLCNAMELLITNPAICDKLSYNSRKISMELNEKKIFGEWYKFICNTGNKKKWKVKE